MGRGSPEIPEITRSQTQPCSCGCWQDIFQTPGKLAGQSGWKCCQAGFQMDRPCPNWKIMGFVTSPVICVLKRSVNNVLMSFSRGVCSVYNEGMGVFGCHIYDLCLAKGPSPFLVYLCISPHTMLENNLGAEAVCDQQLSEPCLIWRIYHTSSSTSVMIINCFLDCHGFLQQNHDREKCDCIKENILHCQECESPALENLKTCVEVTLSSWIECWVHSTVSRDLGSVMLPHCILQSLKAGGCGFL